MMAGKDDVKDPTTVAMEMLAATNQALLAELKAMREGPAKVVEPVMTPDELAAKLMADIRGQSDDVARFGLVEVVFNCKSDFTDATFDAEVHHDTVTSGGKILGRRPGPGRVVKLINYTEPPEASVRVTDGGKVPMDMHELGVSGTSQPSLQYGQWKWENYWQADLKRFIGRPLPNHVRMEAKQRTEAQLAELDKKPASPPGA
jgi:hypothetical protein